MSDNVSIAQQRAALLAARPLTLGQPKHIATVLQNAGTVGPLTTHRDAYTRSKHLSHRMRDAFEGASSSSERVDNPAPVPAQSEHPPEPAASTSTSVGPAPPATASASRPQIKLPSEVSTRSPAGLSPKRSPNMKRVAPFVHPAGPASKRRNAIADTSYKSEKAKGKQREQSPPAQAARSPTTSEDEEAEEAMIQKAIAISKQVSDDDSDYDGQNTSSTMIKKKASKQKPKSKKR